MRTTVTIDEELLAAAVLATGISERSVVLREGLKALIERDAARRLARLGGSDSRAQAGARRHSTAHSAPDSTTHAALMVNEPKQP